MGREAGRYVMLGRYMDGASVAGYELRDTKTGENATLTREQCAFLVGKGAIEGVVGRLYKDTLILEAADGYTKLSELPAKNINTGEFKNVPTGNRKIDVSFDTASLVARTDEGNFVIQTGTGNRVVDRVTLSNAIRANKIINANIQEYTKDGRTQLIVRLSNRQSLKSLPIYSEAQLRR